MRFLLGAMWIVAGVLFAYGAVTGYLATMLAAVLAPSALVHR